MRPLGAITGFAMTVAMAVIVAFVFGRGGASSPAPAYAFDPPATGFYVALDCDPFSPGIQEWCDYPWNTPAFVDVAVVLGNVDQPAADLVAFNFEVTADLGAWLSPLPATGDPLNSNPDFNEAAFHAGFACEPPSPNPDTDPGPLTVSLLVCFEAEDLADAIVGTGETIKLGTVRYSWSSGTPFEQPRVLSLQDVAVFQQLENEDVVETGSCTPVITSGIPCFGATLNFVGHVFPTSTWTPTATAMPTATPTPLPDADGDGAPDVSDNCPSTPNSGQEHADGNIISLAPDKPYNDHTWPNSDNTGDACDLDADMENDGMSDADEIAGTACGPFGPTSPLLRDSDGDRFLDGAECALNTDPTDPNSKPTVAMCGDTSDADGDGIILRNEFCFYNTDPNNADTDGDGCADGKEVASINADLTVSAIDLSQVAQAFGPYPIGAPAYKYAFDMNKDGTISAIDLSFIAQRFGPC